MTPGTPVTNDRGWRGAIAERPKKWAKWQPLALNNGTTAIQQDVVYVCWEERKDHPGGDILSHRCEDLRPLR